MFSILLLPLVVVSSLEWFRIVAILFGTAPMLGLGLDLAKKTLSGAIFVAVTAATLDTLIFNIIYEHVLRPSSDTWESWIAVFVTIFWGVTLFLIMLALRWCTRRQLHSALLRGTARHNGDDLEKRRQIIEAFKGRERQ